MIVPEHREFETPTVGFTLLDFFRRVAEERLREDLPEPPQVFVEAVEGGPPECGLRVYWGSRRTTICFLPERSLWYLDVEKEHVEGFDRVLKNLRRHWTIPQSSMGCDEPGPDATEMRGEQMSDEGIRE